MRQNRTLARMLIAAAAFLCGVELFGTDALAQNSEWYVDAQDGNDTTANGHSWPQAFQTVQRALDEAALSGGSDLIRVAQGVYKPTVPPNTRSATFLLNAPALLDVTIEGGYAGFNSGVNPDTRDVQLYETIFSGDLPVGRAYHVVTFVGIPTGRDRLDGVTITAGLANVTGTDRDRGGGILIKDAGPVIAQCTCYGNSAIIGAAVAVASNGSEAIMPQLGQLPVLREHRADRAGQRRRAGRHHRAELRQRCRRAARGELPVLRQ
jgi:hypothetical protein